MAKTRRNRLGNLLPLLFGAAALVSRGRARREHQRLLEAREAVERASRDAASLQALSVSLSSALTPADVTCAVVQQMMATLGASRGAMVALSEDGTEFRVVHRVGYPEDTDHAADIMRRYQAFPSSWSSPVADAVQSGEPIFLESADARYRRYPQLSEVRESVGEGATASIPLLLEGSTRGVIYLSFAETRTFTDDERPLMLSMGRQAALALERALLYAREREAREAAEEAEHRLTFLSEAATILASSLDYESTLGTVAHLAVPRIADWCAVDVVAEDGSIQRLAVAHVDPAKVRLAIELNDRYPPDPDAPTGLYAVLRSGRPEMWRDITDEMIDASPVDEEFKTLIRDLELRSSMIVPLIARGRTLGAITFVGAESGRRFDAEDLALAQELAARSALAVDNARLYSEAQRAAAERAAILAQMTDAIVICDPQGTVIFVNDAARSLYGHDFVGKSFANYGGGIRLVDAQGEPVPIEELPLQRAIQRRETVLNAETRMRRADGTELIIERTATPVLADDGSLLGAVLAARDVTAQRLLEEQKDAFLSAAAHDLRTPLSTVKGMAQLLQRRAARIDAEGIDRIVEGLKEIDRSTSRMTRLINELLDVTRGEMQRPIELTRVPTNLMTVLQRAIDEIRRSSRGRTISVEGPEEIQGLWDAERLERVFANILANAIKYSPAGGPVDVWVQTDGEDGSSVTIRISDRGIGIPQEEVQRIFERFYRASNVPERIPGTGIGLAGAKQIVDRHGGSIEIASNEGEGTTVSVTLPVLADEPVSASEEPAPASPGA
jgi:signal transduction histidine kinase